MSSLAILLGILSISIPLAGVRTAEAGTTEDSGKKLKIVTTIFPEYDWTRAVLGDREADVDLTMLLDNGTDLHSFQPEALARDNLVFHAVFRADKQNAAAGLALLKQPRHRNGWVNMSARAAAGKDDVHEWHASVPCVRNLVAFRVRRHEIK